VFLTSLIAHKILIQALHGSIDRSVVHECVRFLALVGLLQPKHQNLFAGWWTQTDAQAFPSSLRIGDLHKATISPGDIDV
jgi:hypothetical protein